MKFPVTLVRGEDVKFAHTQENFDLLTSEEHGWSVKEETKPKKTKTKAEEPVSVDIDAADDRALAELLE